MSNLLEDYARQARQHLENVSPESLAFTDACGGAGIRGLEHAIVLGSVDLATHSEADLKKLASAASVLSGRGNSLLWLRPSHGHSTRHQPSVRDQAISIIAECLYPGGGGVSGAPRDGTDSVAVTRAELNAIAVVGRNGSIWPPYVDPDFDISTCLPKRMLCFVQGSGQEEDLREGGGYGAKQPQGSDDEEEWEWSQDKQRGVPPQANLEEKGRGRPASSAGSRKPPSTARAPAEELNDSSGDEFGLELKQQRSVRRRTVRSLSPESVEEVGPPAAAKKKGVKSRQKKKPLAGSTAAPPKKKGKTASNTGIRPSREAAASPKKGRKPAAGKRTAAAGSSAGGKPGSKKRTPLPRATESAEETEARETATAKLQAKKVQNWASFRTARGLEQEGQVERADRRKENDRALQVAQKEPPSSETSKAREPGSATAGYGADDRPFERGEGHPHDSRSPWTAQEGMYDTSSRPPYGWYGGSPNRRRRSRSLDQGRRRGPSSARGRNDSRSRPGGGWAGGGIMPNQRSRSRGRQMNYPGGGDTYGDRRDSRGRGRSRYSRSPSRPYSSRPQSSRGDSRQRSARRGSYSRDRAYRQERNDSRERLRDGSSFDYRARDRVNRAERSWSRERRQGIYGPRDNDWQHMSSGRGGYGGATSYSSRSPRPPSPLPSNSRALGRYESAGEGTGAHDPSLTVSRQEGATANTAAGHHGTVPDGDEPLERLRDAHHKYVQTRSQTLGDLRELLTTASTMESTRYDKALRHPTAVYKFLGISLTNLDRWRKEADGFKAYDDSCTLKQARAKYNESGQNTKPAGGK